MIGDNFIKEIKKYKPLKDVFTSGKNVARYLLDTYFSEVPYTKKRKEWELKKALQDAPIR